MKHFTVMSCIPSPAGFQPETFWSEVGSTYQSTTKALLSTLFAQHYENMPIQIPPKIENFQIKNSDIFHISTQNTACGYSLELPQWGNSDKYPQSMF